MLFTCNCVPSRSSHWFLTYKNDPFIMFWSIKITKFDFLSSSLKVSLVEISLTMHSLLSFYYIFLNNSSMLSSEIFKSIIALIMTSFVELCFSISFLFLRAFVSSSLQFLMLSSIEKPFYSSFLPPLMAVN